MVVIIDAPARSMIDNRASCARDLGERTRIVTSNNTRIVCGTIVVMTCVFAVTYVLTTDRPVEVAIGFMGPIVAAVLASVFNATKLDRMEQKVDQVSAQTNGALDRRMEQIVERRLSATGQPPLHGQGYVDPGAPE